MSELIVSNPLYASLVFDGVALLIVLIFTIVNAKRGFAKTFISVVGYILAIILGGVAGDSSAEPIYNSVLKSQNINSIEEIIQEHDISSAIRESIKHETYGIAISEDKLKNIISSEDGLYNAINGNSEMFSKEDIVEILIESIESEIGEPLRTAFPSPAIDYMFNTMKTNTDKLYSTIGILLQGDKSTAEYIEETFVRPIVVYILKLAIFFIVFCIVMVITKLISKTMENNDSNLNVAGATDTILGAIFGIVEGIVLLLALSLVLKFVISVSADTSELFTNDVIQSTKVFKYIYNLDTLKLLD